MGVERRISFYRLPAVTSAQPLSAGSFANLILLGCPNKAHKQGVMRMALPPFLFYGVACGISVPRPGIESQPLVVKVQSPHPWAAKEFARPF